jgi:hypothetical protein
VRRGRRCTALRLPCIPRCAWCDDVIPYWPVYLEKGSSLP